MKFIDAYILARTKRKTRRIRTALVIIVSSLLFSLLFALALAGGGFKNAIGEVKNVGFNGRNLASVTLSQNMYGDGQGDYNQIVTQMKDELRARNIKVNDQTERDPTFSAELGRRMGQLFSSRQKESDAKLDQIVHDLGPPSQTYHFQAMPFGTTDFVYQPDNTKDPLYEEMKKQAEAHTRPNNGQNDGLAFFTVEGDMLRTQLKQGESVAWQPGDAYPIFVSYPYLEKLSGKSLTRMSNAQKNQAYRDLMKQFAGKELTYCYRNYTAQDQLQQVVSYNYESEHDDKKDTNPLAATVCTGFDQKLLKDKKIVSDPAESDTKPLFPPEPVPAPETITMKLKIVGFVPAQASYGTSDPITQLLTSISSFPTSPFPGIIPTEVVNKDPRLSNLMKVGASYGGFQQMTVYADFKTRAQERAFLDKTCQGDECAKGKVPYINSFGSIEMAFSGLIKATTKGILIGVGVIAGIAGLMIMFTISKVIADSTKEIAVFRALGARRRDIAQIYFTYGLMLTASAALVAFVLATIAALIVSHLFAAKVAAGLVAGTGAYFQNVTVRLWGIVPLWMGLIIAALIVAALIGITIPVLANLRRKLINALREE